MAAARSRNPFALFQRAFERGFERLRIGYQLLLTTLVYRRCIFVPVFLGALRCARFLLFPGSARISFPPPTPASSACTSAPRPARASKKPRASAIWSKQSIRREIPAAELDSILDNIGLPYSGINTAYSNSGVIGTEDADILVALKEKPSPDRGLRRAAAPQAASEFPGVTFYFLPADMVTQILNFGLPAPIDVQVVGNDVGRQAAGSPISCCSQFRQVPGLVDLRIQQPFDQPKLHIAVDRTKAAQAGFTQRDVASSMLVSLSGSFQTHADVLAESEERRQLQRGDADAAVQHSIAAGSAEHSDHVARHATRPEILGDVEHASRAAAAWRWSRTTTSAAWSISSARCRAAIWARSAATSRASSTPTARSLPRGSSVVIRGQIETMQTSYTGLLAGLGVRDRAGLPADRRELPVLARSVHHHHRAARRAGRHRAVPVRSRTRASAFRR